MPTPAEDMQLDPLALQLSDHAFLDALKRGDSGADAVRDAVAAYLWARVNITILVRGTMMYPSVEQWRTYRATLQNRQEQP